LSAARVLFPNGRQDTTKARRRSLRGATEMGKLDEIDDKLRAFIGAQHMFFVATAPLGADGHVNVSPKGLDTLRVLGPMRVAYLDHVGSGTETIAHLI